MRKTLLFTDLHVTDDGQTIIGLDPLDRLTSVMEHAVSRHSDAAALVLLGDLTHHGTSREYLRLKPVLDACPIPIRLTIGNHDKRAVMAETLGEAHLTAGFAQHSWRDGNTLCLLLDTADEEGNAPRHGGWLCPARLGWIKDQIAETRPQKIVAMMHHPPFATGFSGMDAIGLKNGDALLTLLRAAHVPVHLICGHVHRTISGNAHGLPFTVLKSTCHQMPMQLASQNSGLSVDEPGAYGILLVDAQDTIVHTEDVFAVSPTIARDATSE